MLKSWKERVQCPACGGTGYEDEESGEDCTRCGGTTWIYEDRTAEVAADDTTEKDPSKKKPIDPKLIKDQPGYEPGGVQGLPFGRTLSFLVNLTITGLVLWVLWFLVSSVANVKNNDPYCREFLREMPNGQKKDFHYRERPDVEGRKAYRGDCAQYRVLLRNGRI